MKVTLVGHEPPHEYASPNGVVKAGRKVRPVVTEAEATRDPHPALVGSSPAMQELRRAIRVLARRGNSPILVNGETGTGKELVARELSAQRGGPRVDVHCGILGPLGDSLLFGHVRGAFTGAVQRRHGAIERAEDGTLFLDEIGDMPMDQQMRLLRVLDGSRFERLGENAELQLRARVVAATHRDLPAMVRDGRFREDLYHRLSVQTIRVPPLAERLEDLPELVEALMKRQATPKTVTAEAVALLAQHTWPGNVRELAGVVERLWVHVEGETVVAEDVVRAGIGVARGGANGVRLVQKPIDDTAVASSARSFDEQVDAYALRLIERALIEANGNESAAARSLGLSRMALRRRRERHGER